ncbi:hypothetical protein MIR68_012555 [Amoeboaphelidium protococcarum]|nr:hypothetical protein MIR68_012555 [Amoeboaphelidium protococcarum]
MLARKELITKLAQNIAKMPEGYAYRSVMGKYVKQQAETAALSDLQDEVTLSEIILENKCFQSDSSQAPLPEQWKYFKSEQ